MNFNEISGKNITYDGGESDKKTKLSIFFKQHIL